MKNKLVLFVLLMFIIPVVVKAEKLPYCDTSSDKYSEAGCNYIKESAAECVKFYDFCDVYSDSWDSSKCWDYKLDGLCTAEAAAANKTPSNDNTSGDNTSSGDVSSSGSSSSATEQDTIIAETEETNDIEQILDEDSIEEILTLPEVDNQELTCETLFKNGNVYNETWSLLNTSLRFMQFLAIALAIVLSIIDFFKIIPTQDKAALKKAAQNAVKRLIMAVIVFFVPIMLDFVLDLIGITDATCGLL